MKAVTCLILALVLVNAGMAIASTLADCPAAVVALCWFSAGWCTALGLAILMGRANGQRHGRDA